VLNAPSANAEKGHLLTTILHVCSQAKTNFFANHGPSSGRFAVA